MDSVVDRGIGVCRSILHIMLDIYVNKTKMFTLVSDLVNRMCMLIQDGTFSCIIPWFRANFSKLTFLPFFSPCA
ncbi:unnamed protein product [Urochloa humidicola]